jgi:hypothetical protein
LKDGRIGQGEADIVKAALNRMAERNPALNQKLNTLQPWQTTTINQQLADISAGRATRGQQAFTAWNINNALFATDYKC